MKILKLSFFISIFSATLLAHAEDAQPAVKVGVTSVLSGDLAVLGQNVVDTVETYKKRYLRHPIEFVYEDAKLSSADGLRAYQKLIAVDKVDAIIGACTSNGTIASQSLINSSKTPTVTVVTGGKNIDAAGPFVLRVGNSDILNGVQEAEQFVQNGDLNVALLTEETEYTQDISGAFRPAFKEKGGKLLFDETFVPGTTDFRSVISRISKLPVQGVFLPTQTGTALGLFLKQWNELAKNKKVSIHTTFVAAPNPDAHRIAGPLLEGVRYMNPSYDRNNPRLQQFVKEYEADHGKRPPIMFHTAGTIDTLDLLQKYLDDGKTFSRDGFVDFLVNRVGTYSGTMGTYRFDGEGNANVGFTPAVITKEDVEHLE